MLIETADLYDPHLVTRIVYTRSSNKTQWKSGTLRLGKLAEVPAAGILQSAMAVDCSAMAELSFSLRNEISISFVCLFGFW